MNYLQMEFMMEQKGYSVSELAKLTGIPEERLVRVFSGKEKCADYKTILVLEEVLGENEDYVREALPDYGAKRKYTLKDYYALPEDERYELIDGEFYNMASPMRKHQMMLGELFVCIHQYIGKNGGKCKVFLAPYDVQLDCDEYTMVQPDILIVCDPKKITDRCIVGSPDFVVEILSPSTRKKDITIKLRKYRTAGVREYWMVDLEKGHVIVYFFERSNLPVIYGMEDKIPVGIYDGKLVIDFVEISAQIG